MKPPLHGRDWFVRKVRELGEALAALPQARRDRFLADINANARAPGSTLLRNVPPSFDGSRRDT
jgi:hypothetical protein